LLGLTLDQRDCFAAVYLQLQRETGKRREETQHHPSLTIEESTSRMNLLEIMTRENEILRVKDKAWAKEVEKLRDTIVKTKATQRDKEEKWQQVVLDLAK
jgi:hypothetical protein